MDFLHGHSSEVGNTDLAAALASVDIARNKEQPLQVFEGENNRVAFYFESISKCGKYKRHEVCDIWNDQQSPISYPKHPVTYMRCAARNRTHFIKYSKRQAFIGLKQLPAGQFEAVYVNRSEHHDPCPHQASRPAPEAATTPSLQTDDLELASSLLSCGVPLWKELPVKRVDGDLSFFFMPASPCGLFQTRELMLAWQDPNWFKVDPETSTARLTGWFENRLDHPFTYLRCFFENRRELMREIRAKAPMAVFRRAGYFHFLSSDCDARTESLFTKELKKL